MVFFRFINNSWFIPIYSNKRSLSRSMSQPNVIFSRLLADWFQWWLKNGIGAWGILRRLLLVIYGSWLCRRGNEFSLDGPGYLIHGFRKITRYWALRDKTHGYNIDCFWSSFIYSHLTFHQCIPGIIAGSKTVFIFTELFVLFTTFSATSSSTNLLIRKPLASID